jgi:hypothetical protein
MISANYLTAIFLSLTVLMNFQNCGGENAANAKGETAGADKKMISGNFSAETTKSPGFVRLEIKPDGTALLLNVATIHLPPVELERLATKLTRSKDGALCFAEKPKTVEPCLASANDRAVVVKLIPDGTPLKLEKTDK